MQIKKADGTLELFKPLKLRSSLRRAGARNSDIDEIVSKIETTLTDGASTQVIYQKAFELLREYEHNVAAKYSLRRAVYGLGPTGFPFEDFLGRLFEAEGFKVKKRLLIKGKCALHEVDLAAYTPAESFVVEAKFHMRPGTKSDLQVVMYSYARFLDLKSHPVCKGDECGIDNVYVITNTKFTTAAIKYAECTGLKLLSWDYPKGTSLHERIERGKLYPVTVLTKLSVAQKQRLLAAGIILCSDLIKTPDVLQNLGFSRVKITEILEEATSLGGLT